LLAINYEIATQKALLAIKDFKEEKNIQSLRIKYKFFNERFHRFYIEDSKLYSFSIAKIHRHAFYGGFKCEISFVKNNQKFVVF
jgi:hypothetical protein